MDFNITDKNKRTAFITLIITTIIWVLLIIPSIWMTAFSVMIFDAPDSQEKISNWLAFYSIASFPLTSFLALFSWIFYSLKKYKMAIIISLLPIISILFIIIFFVLPSL